jgi:hypothetical protein
MRNWRAGILESARSFAIRMIASRWLGIEIFSESKAFSRESCARIYLSRRRSTRLAGEQHFARYDRRPHFHVSNLHRRNRHLLNQSMSPEPSTFELASLPQGRGSRDPLTPKRAFVVTCERRRLSLKTAESAALGRDGSCEDRTAKVCLLQRSDDICCHGRGRIRLRRSSIAYRQA